MLTKVIIAKYLFRIKSWYTSHLHRGPDSGMINPGKEKPLTIRFTNGLTKESVLLSRSHDLLRVAIEGCDDVTELRRINGVWITDECEPVQVSFAWDRDPAPKVTEADCICDPQVAARLIRLLYVGEEEEPKASPAPVVIAAGASRLIV